MIYILDFDGKVQGVLSNELPFSLPFWDDMYVENIEDALSTYEFKCPAQGTETIKIENYVAIPDLDDQLVLFKIREIQTFHDADGKLYKQVFAENASLELLKTIVRPKSFSGATAEQVLTDILQGTLWQVGNVEMTDVNNIEFTDYVTAIEAIQNVKDTFGGEIRYRVELNGGQISKRLIDLVERRGQYTGKRFTYSKDIKSITRTEDTSELYTAVIGIGKADENGVIPTIKDVTGTFTNKNGTTVTKYAGQDYIGDPDALARWSDDGQHLMGILKTEETVPFVILQKTWDYLQQHTEPKMTYEVEVALLEQISGYEHEKVRLGDTLIIEDLEFDQPLVLEARITEMGISQADPNQNYVKLSNFVEMKITVEQQLQDLMNTVKQRQAYWDSAKVVANNAQEVAEQAQQTATVAQNTANTAQDTAENAQESATNAQNTANTALETANEAQETANTALTSANGKNTNYYGQNAPSNPKNGDIWFVEDAEGNVKAIKHYDGSQWVLDVDNSIIQQTQSDAENALTQANNAVNQANNANSNAQEAINQAQSAFDMAQDASTKADDATNQVSTLSQTVQGLQSTVANKADQSTVTQLASVVDTKVSKTDADAKYATQSQLTQTADSLTSSINSVQEDLNGFESSTNSQISQLSNDINLRVQKNDVINQINVSTEGILIDGKKVHITGQTTIDNAVIKDAMIQSVSASKMTTGTLDADKVTVKNLTASSIKSLNGLNVNNQFVVDSNGNVTFKGNLSGADGNFNGDVIATSPVDADGVQHVARLTNGRVEIETFENGQSIGFIKFNSDGINTSRDDNLSRMGLTIGADDIWITPNRGTNGKVNVDGGINVSGDATINGTVTASSNNVYVDPNKLVTNMVEIGNCGVSGWNPAVSGVFAGTWQPFRVKKTYTPAAINLTTGDSNLTNSTGILTTSITIYGFWLYITNQQATSAFRYWRGTYSA
ncbi:phage tail spike protein [Bacillus smithii]|uniref:phage tail spike protein n=1 Tax=Bacillus smithii TaxID=1479 RepID=UPI003D257763